MVRGDVMHRKQKGFMIALCLCLLSLSGIFGIYRYRKSQNVLPETPVKQEIAKQEPTVEPEKEVASSEGTIAKADTEDKEKDEAKIETEEDIYKIGEEELAKTEETAPEEQPETKPEIQADEQTPLLSFADNSKLMWPVSGNVILNYSMDKSIYFETLNQYKYHPAIVIGAEEGTEVWCAARGKVSEIKIDEETGTTLTMELGSGYEAVYGQLKELEVKEGDMVDAGALIGYVSEPTKYYTVEGSNLYFQLLKDGKPVDPMEYLE